MNVLFFYFSNLYAYFDLLGSAKHWISRFATSKYKEPTGYNISNMFMHLTNYSVNKHSRMYIIDDEIGSKRFVLNL